jgi:hypothetical protein
MEDKSNQTSKSMMNKTTPFSLKISLIPIHLYRLHRSEAGLTGLRRGGGKFQIKFYFMRTNFFASVNFSVCSL